MEERLQKLIAHAGICSRREAEDLITAGLVTVNGDVVSELGAKADPHEDHIKVNGKLLQFDKNYSYVLLYKPKGVVSTVSDPEGRPVVTDFVKGVNSRLYPMGRLDINTEGALLLTNDGTLTQQLLSPRSNCPKTYLVKVSGVPDAKALKRVERGMTIDGTHYGPCRVTVLKVVGKNTWLQVVLTEGKHHQVRKVLENVGTPVAKLKRIAFAALTIEGLQPGEWRYLTQEEVSALKSKRYHPDAKFDPYRFLKDWGVSVSPGDRRKLALFYPDRDESADLRPRRMRGGPRSGGPRKGGSRGGGPRSGGPRSGGPRSGGPRSGGPRSGGPRSGDAGHDDRRADGSRKDGPRSGGPRSGGPRSGGPRSGDAGHDDRRADGPRRDGPRKDGPRKDGPRKDGPRKDGPRKDGPRKDGPRKDGPRKDGPRKDGPRKDGPRKDDRGGKGKWANKADAGRGKATRRSRPSGKPNRTLNKGNKGDK